MDKATVAREMERVREAEAKWKAGREEFQANVTKVVNRLIHEATRHRMSVEKVSELTGYSPIKVRQIMRENGLNPKTGRNLLSKQASEALHSNAELLGVEPHKMNLLSPLAYLPMGEEMRQALTDATTAPVTEFPETGEDE